MNYFNWNLQEVLKHRKPESHMIGHTLLTRLSEGYTFFSYKSLYFSPFKMVKELPIESISIPPHPAHTHTYIYTIRSNQDPACLDT